MVEDWTQRTVDGNILRDQFPYNQIPSSRFDPVAKRLIDQYPAETFPFSPGPNSLRPGDNFFTQRTSSVDVDQWDARIDHRISDNDSIFGSISWSEEEKFQAPPLGVLDAGGFAG